MENPTPQEVLNQVKACLAKTLQATEELTATINAMEDCPEKQEHLKKAEILKGALVQATAKEEPNIGEC